MELVEPSKVFAICRMFSLLLLLFAPILFCKNSWQLNALNVNVYVSRCTAQFDAR